MTFSQHIRSISFDDLLAISELLQQEILRRNTLLDELSTLHLRELRLTINTRDLLYRVLNTRKHEPVAKKNSDFTIKYVFSLLKKEDWLYIEYVNARAFLEIKEVLFSHSISLEEYYGSFNSQTDKSLNRRLAKLIEEGSFK